MDGWERVGCSLGRACTHAPLSNDGRRTQEVSPKDAAGSPQQMELHGPGRVVHSCGRHSALTLLAQLFLVAGSVDRRPQRWAMSAAR